MSSSTVSRHPSAAFPAIRLRRLRSAPWIRALVEETRLDASDLILPLFVQEGKNARTDIPSLPGVSRLSIDLIIEMAKEACALGIPAIALFPVTDPKLKTPDGKEALNPDNLLCCAVRAVKDAVPEIGIITDVALDPYTTHGHDGVLNRAGTDVDNDATVEILARQALLQAKAGADVVAPSDMMDGRVGVIRAALEREGFTNTLILSYAAKYASALYGPFRDAVGSSANLGTSDKRTYQMNPANAEDALREVALDVAEGADMVMVKPALFYLDIIHRVRQATALPVLAYQVSGEYAMLHASASPRAAMLEALIAAKRAGASGIFTYAALDVARGLANK